MPARTLRRAPSLHEVLERVGWRSEPGAMAGRRRIFDDAGADLGSMHASDVWALLRERGLWNGKHVTLVEKRGAWVKEAS